MSKKKHASETRWEDDKVWRFHTLSQKEGETHRPKEKQRPNHTQAL